jgi:uncharacterized protein involved in exopolysaccharide biosynthesis
MESKKNFDTLDIFVFLWKKRKPLIIITLLGIVISVIASMMLDDQYKATTVLFPTPFVSPTAGVFSSNISTDPLIVGSEDDVERLIQLLSSEFISKRVMLKYNLAEHYELSYDDPHLKSKLQKMYQANVSYKKTQYQGVVISVIDVDPQMAADMANEIASLVDSLVVDMQKQRLQEVYITAENVYNQQMDSIAVLEDSLDIYRQMGVLDYFHEVDRYSEAYSKGIANNTLTTQGRIFFEQKIDLLKECGQEYYSITSQINSLRSNMAWLQLSLLRIEQNIKIPRARKFVISYAEAPDKKISPKRSIIVVFSTIGAFVFAIALILFLDFYREFRKRLKEEI